MEVVGVRFNKAGKIYYFDPNGMTFGENETVILETSKALAFGTVVIPKRDMDEDDLSLPLKKIIRKAGPEDAKKVEENVGLAKNAFDICDKKIEEHKLDMHLVDVEYAFDRSKVIFFFIADKRIDFRELVRDLASELKTRIELRQIGVRDEAKIIGGIGPCGLPLCCATYLGDFEPVSIKMAKDQSLSLNPTKISGACGRLMCCLKFENAEYERLRKHLPDVGHKKKFPDGFGQVISVNVLAEKIRVFLKEEERVVEYKLEDIIEK